MTGRTFAACAASLAAGVVGASAVQAAGTWHVFATGSDSGAYGAYPTANANVVNPHALAVRSSKDAKVIWSLFCQGQDNVAAGQVLRLDVAATATCRVDGSASTTGSGTVRIELLKR